MSTCVSIWGPRGWNRPYLRAMAVRTRGIIIRVSGVRVPPPALEKTCKSAICGGGGGTGSGEFSLANVSRGPREPLSRGGRRSVTDASSWRTRRHRRSWCPARRGRFRSCAAGCAQPETCRVVEILKTGMRPQAVTSWMLAANPRLRGKAIDRGSPYGGVELVREAAPCVRLDSLSTSLCLRRTVLLAAYLQPASPVFRRAGSITSRWR
jgi:hypothetical protein